DDHRGDRSRRADPRDRGRALRPLRLARRRQLRGQGRARPPQPVRRARRACGRRGQVEPGPTLVTETQAPPVVDENPLLEGLRRRRTAEPCVLTIFGASGDLTQRKLFPALYALAVRHLLPERFAVLGVARSDMTTEEFRARMREATEENCRDTFAEEIWDGLAEGVRYLAMDFADESRWEALAQSLTELDE